MSLALSFWMVSLIATGCVNKTTGSGWSDYKLILAFDLSKIVFRDALTYDCLKESLVWSCRLFLRSVSFTIRVLTFLRSSGISTPFFSTSSNFFSKISYSFIKKTLRLLCDIYIKTPEPAKMATRTIGSTIYHHTKTSSSCLWTSALK